MQTIPSALHTAPDKASAVLAQLTAPAHSPSSSEALLRGFPGVSFATIAEETLGGAQASCFNLP